MTEAPKKKLPSPRPLGQMLPRVRPHLSRIFGALVCLLISVAIGLAFPQIVRRLLDAAFVRHDSDLLDRIALGLIGLFAIQAVLNFMQVYLLTITSERIVATLRRDLFAHLIRLSPGFFTERRTGELTSRLSADTTVLQTVLSYNLSELARQSLFLIGGIVSAFFRAATEAREHGGAGSDRRSHRHCGRSILADSNCSKLHARR
jgi:ATP-binding cassette, subfamily B, bacterial MsbA